MQHKTINNIIILLALSIISVLFFFVIKKFITVLLVSAIFAAMSYKMYQWINTKLKNKPNLSTALTLVLIAALVFVPLTILTGVVIDEAVNISQTVKPWVEKQIAEPTAFSETLSRLPFYESLNKYSEVILEKAGEAASTFSQVILGYAQKLTFSTLNFAFMFFVFIYTMFFFLRDGEKILNKILYYLPMTDEDERRMINDFTSVSRATIKGTLVIGIIQGTLAGVGFWVAGIDSPVFWSAIMIVLSIIPLIGSALIWIPACLILAAGGHFVVASALAFYCAVLVGSIDNVLRPRMVGKDTKMHELLIFLSTIGGITAFGIIGFIVGPIIAALFVTILDIYGERFKDFLPEVKSH